MCNDMENLSFTEFVIDLKCISLVLILYTYFIIQCGDQKWNKFDINFTITLRKSHNHGNNSL